MKGKSIIKMINPYSNKVEEEFEDENLITNAIPNAFKTSNLYKNRFSDDTTINTFIKNLTPVNTNGLGGILLWDETFVENPNTIIPPMNIKNIGRAGSGYSGTNTNRGTLNIAESTSITNGWRNVWDFDTSKCNGKTIKSLTLTHRNTGNNGWGSLSDINEKESACFFQQSFPIFDLGDSNSYFVTMLADDKALYAKRLSDTQWVLNELTIPNTVTGYKITDVQIGSTVKSSDIIITFPTSRANRIPYVASIEGNIAHFVCVLSSSSIVHVKLNLLNYTVTESIKGISTATLSTTSSYARNCVYYDGNYYLCSSSYNIFKYDLSGAQVANTGIVLSNGFETSVCDGNIVYLYTATLSKPVNSCIIYNGTNIKYLSESSSSYVGIPVNAFSNKVLYPVSLVRRSSNSNSGITLQGTNYYLGTINNLSSPIVKSSDFNMKIVYELTNE